MESSMRILALLPFTVVAVGCDVVPRVDDVSPVDDVSLAETRVRLRVDSELNTFEGVSLDTLRDGATAWDSTAELSAGFRAERGGLLIDLSAGEGVTLCSVDPDEVPAEGSAACESTQSLLIWANNPYADHPLVEEFRVFRRDQEWRGVVADLAITSANLYVAEGYVELDLRRIEPE